MHFDSNGADVLLSVYGINSSKWGFFHVIPKFYLTGIHNVWFGQSVEINDQCETTAMREKKPLKQRTLLGVTIYYYQTDKRESPKHTKFPKKQQLSTFSHATISNGNWAFLFVFFLSTRIELQLFHNGHGTLFSAPMVCVAPHFVTDDGRRTTGHHTLCSGELIIPGLSITYNFFCIKVNAEFS